MGYNSVSTLWKDTVMKLIHNKTNGIIFLCCKTMRYKDVIALVDNFNIYLSFVPKNNSKLKYPCENQAGRARKAYL